jgi:hypothetical protein
VQNAQNPSQDQHVRISERHVKPPGFLEIFLLPPAGICLADAFVNRHNETFFVVMPFLFVAIRMYLAQLKAPEHADAPLSDSFRRSKSAYMAFEHAAAFVLLFVEIGSVVAFSSTAPPGVWGFVGCTYAVYVMLRTAARSRWIRANFQLQLERSAIDSFTPPAPASAANA